MELTPQEKIDVVNQHMKNILFGEYNIVLSLAEAKASDKPNQGNIDILNNQLKSSASQKQALQAELDSLMAQLESSN